MADISLVPLPPSSALWSVTANDWAALNQRVNLVLNPEWPLTDLFGFYVFYFNLQATCSLWQDMTASAIVTQSALLGTFASSIATSLQQLSKDLVDLSPNDPVPHGINYLYTVVFKANADSAKQMMSTMSDVLSQVKIFAQCNQDVDKYIEVMAEKIPLKDWVSVVSQTGSVTQGLTDLSGGMSALVDALVPLTNGQIQITTAGLLKADVAGAIKAWNNLAAETATFNSIAKSSQS